MLWHYLLILLGFSLIGFVAYNLSLGRVIDKGRKWAYRNENPILFWVLVFCQFLFGLTLVIVPFVSKT